MEFGLVGVPVVGITLPKEMIHYWEWEGGETLLRAYREYKWHYGKWKKICGLGGFKGNMSVQLNDSSGEQPGYLPLRKQDILQ